MNFESSDRLLESIEKDDFTTISFSPKDVEEKIVNQLLSDQEIKKIIVLIGPPGIGKSYICSRLKNNSKIEKKSELINSENCLERDTQLPVGVSIIVNHRRTKILFIDNFDRVFQHSFFSPKGNWKSLAEDGNQKSYLDTLSGIKKFMQRDGARLVLTIQDSAYYEIRNDLIDTWKETGEMDCKLDIIPVGVPDRFENLDYLLNPRYQSYIELILKRIFTEGIDSPLVLFLAKIIKYKVKHLMPLIDERQPLILEIEKIRSLISASHIKSSKIIEKMCSRLGLCYVPDYSSEISNVIFPGNVITAMEKETFNLGIFPTKSQKILNNIILGLPLSLGVTLTIYFLIALSGLIKNIPLIWLLISAPVFVFLGAFLIGNAFENWDRKS